MRLSIAFAILLLASLTISAQTPTLQRPKLVVGIVVDQMRWDYLYRFYDRYAENGGFKRMLNQGFTCENTLIPYAPTVTACGHASIYTGSVPAINGITGNAWYDKIVNADVYCTDDSTVKTVGSATAAVGRMSPRNMLVTTICDELRLATNFRSKVVGIALKDRGGILPAGHTANAAYWYDNRTGNWVSSTYYMKELPKWSVDFNARRLVDSMYMKGWNTLYPINTYVQSTADKKAYEIPAFGEGFPYAFSQFIGKNYNAIAATPHGNTLTAEFAKASVNAEQLGADDITDFLALSFSSPDYIGHTFGPNSVEAEDCYLRLDQDLANLFDFLDTKVGKNQYLVFLSADHGAAHVPGFSQENKIPAGRLDDRSIADSLNVILRKKYGKEGLVMGIFNYQVILNDRVIKSDKLNRQEIIDIIIDYCRVQPGITRVFSLEKMVETSLPQKQKQMLINGYYPNRCGDVQLILSPQWIENFPAGGTTHGLWNPYDAHIPLLWYGWNIKPGKTNRETSMADIAPTIAALLRIQMPSGNVGTVIEEVIK